MARALNAQWVNPFDSWETVSSKKGLGPGAWAGIGIACVVALGAIVGAGVFWAKRKNKKGVKLVSTADTHMDAKLDTVQS